jgi:hypothetical protein
MKAVRRVAVLMAVCACVSAIACSRQEAQGPSESAVGKPVATPEPVEAPTHSHDLQPIPEGLRILSEEKADSHGSARLKLLVSVPRETTRSQMEEALRALYEQQMGRRDFIRGKVDVVLAWIYLEGVDWESYGSNWVARIGKGIGGGPVFENTLTDGNLVDQVRAIAGEDVVQTREGIRVTHTIDDENWPFGPRSPKQVAETLSFSATHYPGELYDRVGTLDSLEMLFTRKGKTIGRIRMTYDDYLTWDYRAKMEDVVKAQDVVSDAKEAGRLTSAQADARYGQISHQAQVDLLLLLPAGAAYFAPEYRRWISPR